MAHAQTPSAMYGLLAEFDSAGALLQAARHVHDAGYVKTDAFSPFPIHGLAETLGFRERRVAPIILAGGIIGLLGGYGLQYWIQVIAYPLNIGGRPTLSWVAWIPPMFETTVLVAAIAAVVGMLALNGLPQPHHPVFNAPRFGLASQDKFFLLVEASDPKFDADRVRSFLAGLHPREVVELAE
jgi:Alternative complex III, ActD subunit